MDTYLTLRPINFLFKCFALNCVHKKDNVIISSWSLIKNLFVIFILCSSNVIVLYDNIQKRNFKSFEFTSSDIYLFMFVLNFLKYIVDLIYVRKYGTKDFVSYYYSYNKIDETLKFNNYNEIKMTCLKIMTSFCAFLSFSIILDFFSWFFLIDTKILYIIAYLYNFETVLVILDIVCHVVQVEYRLRRLGDIVEKFNKNDEDGCGTITPTVISEATRLDRLRIFYVRATKNGTWTLGDILPLSQCYLMLIKQTEFMNIMFGFRIILICIFGTIDLINLLNITIRALFAPQLTGFDKLPFLSSIFLFLVICFNIYTLAHRCEKVYRQSDRIIGIVDDLIIYRNASEEIILPLKELRELISSRPIRFHTSHFFRIDYTLLSATMSVVVTYTIIFLQSLKFGIE